MTRARHAVRRSLSTAVRRCKRELGLAFPIAFVLHVGIGCGAGWATTFGGRPAVLFGLENAAELGWTDRKRAIALVEHEIAHLLHDRWRHRARRGRLENHHGPWWQLYEEGFATHWELSRGAPEGRHTTGRGRDWLLRGQTHRSRLASLYLRTASSPKSRRRFFGLWYPLKGHIETGYFPGAEVIREWSSTASLREIAVWTPEQVRRRARASLRRMAAGNGTPAPRGEGNARSGIFRARRLVPRAKLTSPRGSRHARSSEPTMAARTSLRR